MAARAGGVDDTFSVRFRLVSGVTGMLQQTSAAWGRRADTTRVTGTTGTLRLERGTVVVADADGDHELAVPDDLALPEVPPSDDPRHRFTHLELGPYTRLCETLRARIEGRPDPTPVAGSTFADGVASMRVLDAVRASAARDGELVRL